MSRRFPRYGSAARHWHQAGRCRLQAYQRDEHEISGWRRTEPGRYSRLRRFPGLPAPPGGGSSGGKQEYNFFILVSVTPARGQLHTDSRRATDRHSPEGEGYEHEWTRTYYGARGCLGRHGAFHERVQPPGSPRPVEQGSGCLQERPIMKKRSGTSRKPPNLIPACPWPRAIWPPRWPRTWFPAWIRRTT